MESIELDCPPGGIRPWHLIEGVVEGTGLKLTKADLEPGAMFGHREWLFDVPRDKWVAEIQPVIKPRIEALYRDGVIRYGSW